MIIDNPFLNYNIAFDYLQPTNTLGLAERRVPEVTERFDVSKMRLVHLLGYQVVRTEREKQRSKS